MSYEKLRHACAAALQEFEAYPDPMPGVANRRLVIKGLRDALIPSASTESTDTVRKENDGGWIRTADRPPTKEDADQYTHVFALNELGGCLAYYLAVRARPHAYPYWMRIPPVPKD